MPAPSSKIDAFAASVFEACASARVTKRAAPAAPAQPKRLARTKTAAQLEKECARLLETYWLLPRPAAG